MHLPFVCFLNESRKTKHFPPIIITNENVSVNPLGHSFYTSILRANAAVLANTWRHVHVLGNFQLE